MLQPVPPLDPGDLEGGFVRMMQRYHTDGTLTGDAAADAFVRDRPLALLLGLLYDQRIRAEIAFTGPQRLHDRLGHLDAARLAGHDADALRLVFAERPVVHRFHGTMADLTQRVCTILADRYDGDAARLWNDGADAATLGTRLRELPGFGPDKASKLRYVLHYFGHRSFAE